MRYVFFPEILRLWLRWARLASAPPGRLLSCFVALPNKSELHTSLHRFQHSVVIEIISAGLVNSKTNLNLQSRRGKVNTTGSTKMCIQMRYGVIGRPWRWQYFYEFKGSNIFCCWILSRGFWLRLCAQLSLLALTVAEATAITYNQSHT